jgi:hypothetical protein
MSRDERKLLSALGFKGDFDDDFNGYEDELQVNWLLPFLHPMVMK